MTRIEIDETETAEWQDYMTAPLVLLPEVRE